MDTLKLSKDTVPLINVQVNLLLLVIKVVSLNFYVALSGLLCGTSAHNRPFSTIQKFKLTRLITKVIN